MGSSIKPVHEPWFLKFRHLMPFKVYEVLLVSSAYDAFTLEEDGRLDERLHALYAELSMASPLLLHVSTAKEAMEMLKEGRFDMVITVTALVDTNAGELSRAIKAEHPKIPVVLLAFDEADLNRFPGGQPPPTIDRVFLWTGDARILIAALKLEEDHHNVEHDVAAANLPVILVVEDSLRRYSTFLSDLYTELLTQSHSLVAEGVNAHHRLMRRRARPKILLATHFEAAEALYWKYHANLLAVISDVRFPEGGKLVPDAGFTFIEMVRKHSGDIPVVIYSAEPGIKARASALHAWHIDKNSDNIPQQIRNFLKESLGFGDFIFRLPDRTEVGRARDLYEMRRLLRDIPAESLRYHAAHNHFSTWLKARALFNTAIKVRARQADEFGSMEELRHYLIGILRLGLMRDEEGGIADHSVKAGAPERTFIRIGSGSLGGKGRGIAFVNAYLFRNNLTHHFPDLTITIPKTAVIGALEFEHFLTANEITYSEIRASNDNELRIRFLAGELSEAVEESLRNLLPELRGPLAVRSSSLLEDSRFQPFAGIYATYMLPNNHPSPRVRLSELRQAIKAVYASTFSANARAYLAGTPHALEDERMAVVIQELVGNIYGHRFYPHISGIAQSNNYYPAAGQRSGDGVALIALGLGQTVVSGRRALRFSPASPSVLPQFSSAWDFMRQSQNHFYALDLRRHTVDFREPCESSLQLHELSDAEEDGTLQLLASVYSADDDTIRDNLHRPGPRVVTFNNILKWNTIPLAEALQHLLLIFRQGMGSEVEMEFAVDLTRTNRCATGQPYDPPTEEQGESGARLYVLQLRPMATQDHQQERLDLSSLHEGDILCRAGHSLGHGHIRCLHDIVFVKQQPVGQSNALEVAREVGIANAALTAKEAPYLLIGPGRWGTSDPTLGIPVEWSHISGARVIVETSLNDRMIEPSQGTHFFQNVTVLRIGYLTVCDLRQDDPGEQLDRDWLEAQSPSWDGDYVRHIHLSKPLSIYLDGLKGTATILKHRPEPE